MESTSDGTGRKDHYLSYLLRLWRESGENAVWRASLEHPHTGERTSFATPRALFSFLRDQMDSRPGQARGADCSE